jgi:hypothetical protein
MLWLVSELRSHRPLAAQLEDLSHVWEASFPFYSRQSLSHFCTHLWTRTILNRNT